MIIKKKTKRRLKLFLVDLPAAISFCLVPICVIMIFKDMKLYFSLTLIFSLLGGFFGFIDTIINERSKYLEKKKREKEEMKKEWDAYRRSEYYEPL